MTTSTQLHLGFHGRIIEHIGIQMYQSPTAALAEIVSNAWDADATEVDISFNFDADRKSDWTITVQDNGNGMTKDECQQKFLSVGFNRREQDGPKATSVHKLRPLMGRKGIGKFAGFGIARFIKIDTVSKETGEQTVFELDQEVIRKGDSYVSTSALDIEATHSKGVPTGKHGTKITLRDLDLNRRIPVEQFRASLARRFLINSTADEFAIKVDNVAISDSADHANVEMSFPRDLPDTDKTERGVTVDSEGWGTEVIAEGKVVHWRVQFFKELVKNEELFGITIFAHKKLAQRPFMFNLSGGLASQAGPEYMSGQVVADWVDEFGDDVISTERQRLRWEHPELSELQDWGQKLIRRLLSIWKSNRNSEKLRLLETKVGAFSERLKALGSEATTVRTALTKLAQVEKISSDQFQDLGSAILLAWEGGRLKGLIEKIARTDEMDEAELVGILAEANAITALHTAETVNAKLQAINGLEARISRKELENAVRDYIAQNPWLISPRWETFAVEKRLATLCNSAANESFKDSSDFNKRVDLILSSDRQLLILEFMRPGITLDADHLRRFGQYMDILQEYIEQNTALGLEHMTGYIVADSLAKKSGHRTQIKNMNSIGRYAMDWESLIQQAKHQWKEFLIHVKERSPEDARLKAVGTEAETSLLDAE
ncbi:MAG: ATP-binding protein [Gemmobacter sp.]|jgi:hypothetical protein|nr:ATP-binding protein [Gemmobacter sp.]